jgi:hypothetical protein
LGALLKQLPSKSEMDALLTDINQAGLGRGLQFELFKPAASESMSEFCAELPIQLKISGGYHDFGAFATDISQLSRIVTLNDISLAAGKDGQIVMDSVDAKGVGVRIEARHLCMMMRGVEKQNSTMLTSSVLGVFRDHLATREEFLSLVGRR